MVSKPLKLHRSKLFCSSPAKHSTEHFSCQEHQASLFIRIMRNENATLKIWEDDEDDDSLGSLPTLTRQKSLCRNTLRVNDTVGHSLAARSARFDGVHAPHTTLTKNKHSSLDPLSDLGRSRSVAHLPKRSMSTSLASQKTRPDPPGQVRPGNSACNARRCDEESEISGPSRRAKTLNVSKVTQRTLSMPIIGQREGFNPYQSEEMQSRVKRHNTFRPSRSKSIRRSFPEDQMSMNHDVWIQHVILKDGKEPEFFFKSVFSSESRPEPPTGAVNVVYMEEIVKIQPKCADEADKAKRTKNGTKKPTLFFWKNVLLPEQKPEETRQRRWKLGKSSRSKSSK